MNTLMKNSILALLLVCATSVTVSAQIKPSKKKTTTTEKTEQPSESNDTDSKPSTTTKKKTTTSSSKKTDQYFDESGGFKHRLWYGGNMNLNFGGDGLSYSLLTMGITPMVGYKIVGGLSAGPRLGINYNRYKVLDSQNQGLVVNLTDYTVGAFTRYKVFKNFFAHAEADYYSFQLPGTETAPGTIIKDVNGKVFKFRYSETNYYAGVGYNSGGLIGYEIMALYNFSIGSKTNDLRSPIDIRFGFTYNF
ncbi:MAG: hypothetical protein JNL70_08860 [Saprospiraceae bacterium]|nr:hypothetical protein [Saprospiraceae bacterium]